jgi:hypothetical protein
MLTQNNIPQTFTPTLMQLKKNAASASITDFSKTLLLYEEKLFPLGDCCIHFGKIKYLRTFLNNGLITVNFSDEHNEKYIDSLLKNNTDIDTVSTLQWEELQFDKFDLIICILFEEEKLLHFLHEKYGPLISTNIWKPVIYSTSWLFWAPADRAKAIFPSNLQMNEFLMIPRQTELYISEEERMWGNNWLMQKGLEKHEKLFIIIDSAGAKGKLLNEDVFFGFLSWILEKKNIKVLAFDEGNTGKEDKYRQWLGEKAMEKLIFSTGMKLRQDLCLVASAYTSMVFGPCSGMMHCASAIYNHYVMSAGMTNVPSLFVYAGLDEEKNYNLFEWWGESPLVNCFFIREEDGEKKVISLNSLTVEEGRDDKRLPSSAYTTKLLIDFIGS